MYTNRHTFLSSQSQLEQSKLSVEEASEILSLKHKPSGYLPPQQDRARNKALSQGWRSIFAGKPLHQRILLDKFNAANILANS